MCGTSSADLASTTAPGPSGAVTTTYTHDLLADLLTTTSPTLARPEATGTGWAGRSPHPTDEHSTGRPYTTTYAYDAAVVVHPHLPGRRGDPFTHDHAGN